MDEISVLIPTYNRTTALAVTLSSLYYQSENNFSVIISDQTLDDINEKDASVLTALNLLALKGIKVHYFKNLPFKGIAQQRDFLLQKSNGKYCLFLDDDIILEPFVIKNLKSALQKEGCGFVGNAVIGLSYLKDVRPYEHHIELWKDKITPEYITPDSNKWNRYVLHNAANILHIQTLLQVTWEQPVKYKVAWIGGCVMYDTEKLKEVGGFSFWNQLPIQHCGEDALVQLRIMKKYGGCGILPSGAYHQELKTTIPNRKFNAPEFLKI